MPQVKSIERRIEKLEGFKVRFVTSDGQDVRGDKQLAANYDAHINQAADTMSVSRWRDVRFATQFPGFDCLVLDGEGEPVHGRTLLRTVRGSYR